MNPAPNRKTVAAHRETVPVPHKTAPAHRETVPLYRKAVYADRKTVIPNGASRRFFLRVRSCERVGLRREESLFDVPACSARKSRIRSSLFSKLCVLRVSVPLCVKSFSSSFPTTHYSLPTIHLLP